MDAEGAEEIGRDQKRGTRERGKRGEPSFKPTWARISFCSLPLLEFSELPTELLQRSPTNDAKLSKRLLDVLYGWPLTTMCSLCCSILQAGGSFSGALMNSPATSLHKTYSAAPHLG